MQSHKDYFIKAAQIYEKVANIHQEKQKLWLSNVAFTWQWWLGVALATLPWVLWMFFRRKESTWRLLASGLFVIIICSWFDVMGTTLSLWHYNFDVIPMLPSYVPWDFTILPVFVMCLIQYKPRMNPIMKAVFFAGFSAFIGEPLFAWLKLYDPQDWKGIYSFLIFVVIYLIAHFISSRKNFEALGSSDKSM